MQEEEEGCQEEEQGEEEEGGRVCRGAGRGETEGGRSRRMKKRRKRGEEGHLDSWAQ